MKVENKRTFIGRLPHKADLLSAITEVAKKENVTLGVFTVIGAVSSAKLGYYKQDEKNKNSGIKISHWTKKQAMD